MARVAVIGVPLDLGAGRRGVDMGPSAIRYARLHEELSALGHEVVDLGDLEVPLLETLSRPEPPRPPYHLEEIAAVCRRLFRRLATLDEEVFPLVLGGDHSLAVGSVPGAARGQRVGVIWVDAHGDFNTPETSPSGNVHGMPLAALLGLGDPRLVGVGGEGPKLRPEDVVLVGVRSLDPGERALLRAHRVPVYTMTEVDRLGVAAIAEAIVERFRDYPRVHLSLDADVLDPELAPGVGTPVPGGLSYREAHLLMELLSQAGVVTSLDLVEVNPILDRRNRTAEIAVELAASLLGKRIL